jgi:hypothetical protein
MRGESEQARIRYRRSRALLEEYGYRLFAALTSMDSAPVEMLAGDLDAAEPELRGWKDGSARAWTARSAAGTARRSGL